jgi:hypothetical protein
MTGIFSRNFELPTSNFGPCNPTENPEIHRKLRTIWTIVEQGAEPQPGGGVDKIIKDKIMGAEGTAGWGNLTTDYADSADNTDGKGGGDLTADHVSTAVQREVGRETSWVPGVGAVFAVLIVGSINGACSCVPTLYTDSRADDGKRTRRKKSAQYEC